MSAARIEPGDGDGRFRVSGELSFATVPELDEQSRTLFAGARALSVDLGGVGRADSAGVALLVEWTARARAAGQAIVYVAVPAQLCELVRVNGLESVLPFADSEPA